MAAVRDEDVPAERGAPGGKRPGGAAASGRRGLPALAAKHAAARGTLSPSSHAPMNEVPLELEHSWAGPERPLNAVPLELERIWAGLAHPLNTVGRPLNAVGLGSRTP